MSEPAFPRITGLMINPDTGIGDVSGNDGMSLFDFYAAQAMAAYIISLGVNSAGEFTKRSLPMHACHMAKNMIEERKKYMDEETQ